MLEKPTYSKKKYLQLKFIFLIGTINKQFFVLYLNFLEVYLDFPRIYNSSYFSGGIAWKLNCNALKLGFYGILLCSMDYLF